MNTASKKPRLLFLDNIKVLFTILVIFQHVRVTYNGMGWWYYIEPDPGDTFSTIFFIILASVGGLFQSSLMGLFFLMGGFFTPKSYDRKGGSSFWKERLARLGIPLLLYTVLVNPIMYRILSAWGVQPWSSNPALQGSMLDFYSSRFQSLKIFINFITDAGPMWFLYVLLIFTACYALWRQITKSDSIQRYIPKEFPIPRYFHLLLFAIGLGCVAFLVRVVVPIDKMPLGIPFSSLPQYLTLFSVGIIIVRYDWFEKMGKDHIRAWSITIVAAYLLITLYYFLFMGIDSDMDVFLGGFSLPAFLFALADAIICVGMILVLLGLFHAKFNHQGTLLQNLSASAFHMYLIHPPILVLVALGFASIALVPAIKLAIVWPLTVILCYLTSHYVLQKTRLKK